MSVQLSIILVFQFLFAIKSHKLKKIFEMEKQNVQFVDSLLYETFLLQKRDKFFNENNNQQKVVPSTSKRDSGNDGDINESECEAKTKAMKNLTRSKDVKILPKSSSSSSSGKSSFLRCNRKSLCSSHQNKGTRQENKLWECPICFEQSKGQEVVTTICGHVFCHICILEHLRQSKCSRCPSCRSPIGNNTLITLYNV